MARGPWDPADVQTSWLAEPFEPDVSRAQAADVAIDELRRRGSPSHDGWAARLVSFDAHPDRLALELQPVRWALRLLPEDAAQSLSAICVVRVGRRALAGGAASGVAGVVGGPLGTGRRWLGGGATRTRPTR